MGRSLVALLSGALFGIGLMISGMTDTTKVIAWLDFFGDWDPTLAFVMGGAMIPVAIAWRFTTRGAPLTGGSFPPPSRTRIERHLVIGSVLFGAGWGLVGLCPGPALASLAWGGWPGMVFLAAMLAGMWATPAIRTRLDAGPRPRLNKGMDIRYLTPAFAVSPQITPDDIPAIKAAGFTTVIDNRPDSEVPYELSGSVMRIAAEAAGLTFIDNPVTHPTINDMTVGQQMAAAAGSTGPVFAYCASGTRSSILWSLGQVGKRPADEILAATAKAGYDLSALRGRLG